ncbi:hypothetical protein HDV02_000765 [Globomyces sp. JEL0801]|nr:hypothetical protein HDV02_000765 [Globomyces sp. JEL0801]
MPPKGKGKKKGKKDLNKEKELEEQKRLAEEEARKEEERLKKEKEAKELRTRELIIQFFNQWEKYLECSILPSPKCERDLNTYLMLWAEEKLIFEDVPSLTPLYSQLPNGQILLKQIEFERGYCADFGDFKRYNNLHSYMITLYNILLKKWDETSQQFLQVWTFKHKKSILKLYKQTTGELMFTIVAFIIRAFSYH